ncbi:Bromo domain-containing protein [Plasmodiophora brassicae]|uniref:Bromo domain-containing protein n=1 Tax=Plasmodiophora brassicae TaxID=37360 RepID=A0A0G4J1W6_PLABS|nr:hypothetical protein PBRA_002170 [Plasmodiophora brassicae]SPQ93164.1 unnamed protein product [Plasmodiophora brassicae]
MRTCNAVGGGRSFRGARRVADGGKSVEGARWAFSVGWRAGRMSGTGGSNAGSASKKRKVSEGGTVAPAAGENEVVKLCMPILKQVAARADAAPFLDPVDWEELGIPDYPEIIKNPMDLGTIKKKLEDGKYANEQEFADDVRLTWNNAKTYNQPGSGIYVAADNLSKLFDRRMQKLKKPEPSAAATGASAPTPAGPPPSKKKKPSTPAAGVKPVTQQDKVKFSQLVNQLTPQQIGRVVDMISKACPEALNEEDEEDLEIEVDKIDRDTLHNLNVYCESCVAGGNDTKKKKK